MFVLSILACLGLSCRAKADENNAISIQTKMRYDAKLGYVARFEIRNVGAEAVVLPISDLPWRTLNRLKLVAIPLSYDEPRTPILPIEDPIVAFQNIPAGQSIEGELVLGLRFDRFRQLLLKSDIALFWSIQLVGVGNSEPFDRASGVLILPKLR